MVDFETENISVRIGIRALAEQMAKHGAGRDEPVRAISAMVGDRWSNLIILVLETGEARHADLKRVLGELSAEQIISQRVLTLKLRNLERHGLVKRTVSIDVPPKVSYRLTRMGIELVYLIRGLIDWIGKNQEVIENARYHFDKDK